MIGMIKDNVKALLAELPEGVRLVAAAKTRSATEILEALEAGVEIIGENYEQDLIRVYDSVKVPVLWHFIGHLQTNKVRQIVDKVDMIETLDSLRLAEEINKRCAAINKVMPVLVEINSAEESAKAGVRPADAENFVGKIAGLKNIAVKGLMTMGPLVAEDDDLRMYFSQTRRVFDKIKLRQIEGVEMKYLSMGMTSSYKLAIGEGANMVRIGTRIFGERNYD